LKLFLHAFSVGDILDDGMHEIHLTAIIKNGDESQMHMNGFSPLGTIGMLAEYDFARFNTTPEGGRDPRLDKQW
jgi:hypothetical protein